MTNRLLCLALMVGMVAVLFASGARGAVAAPPEAPGTVHVVQWGENLTLIAQRYGVTVQTLMRANKLSSADWVYAGQRLIIPGAGGTPSSGATHVVQRGETLAVIAARYGTTVNAIAQANRLSNPSLIYAGQRLVIPGGGGAASATRASSGVHVVQRGETLAAIAYRYGTSTWAIAQANNLANPSFIYAGQRLVIPRGSAGGGKRIVVDISEQRLYAYQGDSLIYNFVASTGQPGLDTLVGQFKVISKIPNAYNYDYGLTMPHWLGIYWAGSLENGIHALPIQGGQRLWSGYLGSRISWGCIVLGTEAARKLYNWAEMGTPVIIQN